MLTWLVALPLAASLAACNDKPADPAALAAQAALRVQDIVHNGASGVAFAGDSDSTTQKILSGIGTASDGIAGGGAAAMPPVMPPPMMMAMEPPLMRAMSGMSMMTTQEQIDDAADKLKTYLQERIFVDSNLESTSADGGVYLLHADPTCRPLPADGDPAGTLPDIDAKCADQLGKLQVRIDLRTDGDGVRLAILLGPDRLQLSVFIVHSDLLAIEVDLAQAKKATDYINATLGDQSPMSSTQLTRLMGRVRYSLHKDGDQKVTLAYSVLDAIDVAISDATGPVEEIKMASADPALSVSGDGVARSLTVRVNLGQTDTFTTWDPKGTGVRNSDYHVSLGGITGQSTLMENAKDLTVAGLGIGETFLEVRGTKIFDLNLNPGDMRRFDLHATLNADDMPRFEVTPRFDLTLDFHLGAVAADYVTQPASYLLDETYGFLLVNGASPSVVEAVRANATGFAGGLKVAAGTLTISTTGTADPVSVTTGKCLTGNPTPASGSHPVLGKLSVVDCP